MDTIGNGEKDSKRSEGMFTTKTGVAVLALIMIGSVGMISGVVTSVRLDSDNVQAEIGTDEISEAGLAHAVSLLSSAEASSGTRILSAGDGRPGTGDELLASSRSLGGIPRQGIPFGGGMYRVFVQDDSADDEDLFTDSNGVLSVRVVAVKSGYETSEIEADIRIGETFPAILTNGTLRLSGRLIFLGAYGYPSSTGPIISDAGICADSQDGNLSDVWQGTATPDCRLLEAFSEKALRAPVTAVDIDSEFRPKADFILGADRGREGLVFNRRGEVIHRAGSERRSGSWTRSNSEWRWLHHLGVWRHRGTELPHGSYHSEGNIELHGPLGSAAAPASISLSAKGYVKISGPVHILPNRPPYIAVAGTDLVIENTKDQSDSYSFRGLMRANDQIAVSGGLMLMGSLISANFSDDESPDCGCNPAKLIDGIQVLRVDGVILNRGDFDQSRIRSVKRGQLAAGNSFSSGR